MRPPVPLGILFFSLLPHLYHLPKFSVYLYSAYFYTFATYEFIQNPIYSVIFRVHIMICYTCSGSFILTVV